MHIIHEGSGGGGATLALTYFPRYLAHFQTVAITGSKGDLAVKLEKAGVRTFALPLDRPVRCLLSIPLMAWRVWREKPTTVVVHGQWGGFAGAVGAWLAGVKRIIYYTHMPSFYTDWDLYRLIRNRVAETVTCRLAHRVICPSRANRYQYLLRQLVSEDRCQVIPNGLDPQRYAPVKSREEIKRDLGLNPAECYVVSVGRLSDQKRVDWLVHAWALVEKQKTDATLLIIGDGEERAFLENLAKELNLQHCQFLGRQPDGWRYFQAADCGVITTMFEAQPYALLEAMACGCPMIGTMADGVAETIEDGHTGLRVRVADPEALAQAIQRLLSDTPLCQSMSQAAQAKVKREYDLADIIDRQIEVVRQLTINN
jgi:glycosyltransferase involved in cell wall biosynthesis